MTKQEAKKIPELNIEVDDLTEAGFYLRLAMENRLSKESVKQVVDKLNNCDPEKAAQAIIGSAPLYRNLEKYGIPCAAWCAE